MESKVKLLGHPIHPMLIVFPLGLLVIGVLFDIIRMFTGNDVLAAVAFWNIAAGVVGGLLAALFGFIIGSASRRAREPNRSAFCTEEATVRSIRTQSTTARSPSVRKLASIRRCAASKEDPGRQAGGLVGEIGCSRAGDLIRAACACVDQIVHMMCAKSAIAIAITPPKMVQYTRGFPSRRISRLKEPHCPIRWPQSVIQQYETGNQ